MVQAGEVQNAAHHPGEAPGAVQNLLGVLTLLRRGDVRFPQQHRIALNGGERRLELMGYPGNEVLPQGFHRPQFLHHGVEVPGDLPHLQNGAVGVALDGGILRRGNTGRGKQPRKPVRKPVTQPRLPPVNRRRLNDVFSAGFFSQAAGLRLYLSGQPDSVRCFLGLLDAAGVHAGDEYAHHDHYDQLSRCLAG